MYGLLLESLREAITTKYGAETWRQVRHQAELLRYHYLTHDTYSETTLERLVDAVSDVTGASAADVMQSVGRNFIIFVARVGYEDILRVNGRRLRDFIDGLDNIHEYVRRIYPAMQAPSFRCENETSTGLTVHYCSHRRGLVPYVIGQLGQVRTGHCIV